MKYSDTEDKFLVLDGRAWHGVDESDCTVYVSCTSLKEARRFLHEDFPDGRIARYRWTGEKSKDGNLIFTFVGWEESR